MPLFPWRAFADSPSSLRIRNVPKRIGKWNIDHVSVQVTYPDGRTESVGCVLVGGVWTCTVPAAATPGTSEPGYGVFADGTDENGNPVTGYCLGRGAVEILDGEGSVAPGTKTVFMHMLSAQPTDAKDGDVWQVNGSWYIYQDGQAWAIGDESGAIGEISAQVGQLSSAINKKADKSQLAQYEQKSELRTDVGNIVTERAFTDWNYPEQVDEYWYAPEYDWIRYNGDKSKTYYVIETIWNATGMDNWLVNLYTYAWDDEYTQSWQPVSYFEDVVDAPEDTLELNCTFVFPVEGTLTFHLTRENINVLGLAMMSDISAKQDKLTDPQISAIDSVVDERATTITFDEGGTSTYDWAGEINRQTLVDAGIYDATQETWLMHPTDINIGTGVTSIGANAFDGCSTLGGVTIPDSVTSIGASAFANCYALANVTIGNGLKNVGDYAFQNCSVLGQVTLPANVNPPGVDAFAGTPAYFYLYLVEAVPNWVPGSANYPWGVSNTDHIKTIRNATIEWVTDQGYGKGCDWRDVTVNNRTHVCNIYPF